jgi:hypothetical protein
MPQLLDYGVADVIVGYADTYCVFFGFQLFGHLPAGIEYEGVWSGQGCFEQPENGRGYTFGIIAEVAKIGTNKRKLRFLGFYVFDPGYAGNGIGVEDITTYAINSVCWIDYYPTIAQAFYHGFYGPWLRIVGMYFQQHVCFCIKLQSLGVKAIGCSGACVKHMTDITAITGPIFA